MSKVERIVKTRKKKEGWKYTFRCSECGRFCVPVDHYTNFGSSNDIEPPDEIIICEECRDKEIAFYKKLGIMPRRWIPAEYEEKLAKELGYIWYIPKGCGWGYWIKPTQLEFPL